MANFIVKLLRVIVFDLGISGIPYDQKRNKRN